MDNIADQSQTGTVIEYASLFNFNNPIDTEKRIEYLKELHAIYCVSYNHTVTQNEDDKFDFRKHIMTIRIKYEAKTAQEHLFWVELIESIACTNQFGGIAN